MTTSDLATILVVEDEISIRRLLGNILELSGFRVLEADSAAAALKTARLRCPDLVLLDLGLPDDDGSRVLAELREWNAIPVIVLSARSEENEKVRLLEMGADDFVTKPFGSSELIARIKAALRRSASPDNVPALSVGPLKIDLVARQVTLQGEAVVLARKEFGLLALLARHRGKVVTHSTLLRELWGPVHANDVHYVRILIQKLRGKIEPDPGAPSLILTELGVGYRLAQ
ncbi:MAG: response regulator transcription factor [Rhizobiales bacterium]|nr:response regulator transcription factor [Hyphomicrobiales bacterium]